MTELQQDNRLKELSDWYRNLSAIDQANVYDLYPELAEECEAVGVLMNVANWRYKAVPMLTEGRAGLTHHMADRFYEAFDRNEHRGDYERLNAAYNAMLRAAPEPDTAYLSDEQILHAAKLYFAQDKQLHPRIVEAYCESVRAVITSYCLVKSEV